MWPDTLAVLGLGALGGSLAWQARQAGVDRVIGYSANTADASQALRAGAISDRAQSVSRACRGASVVVVAGSLPAVTRALAELAPHLEPGAVITDLAPLRVPVQESAHESGLADRHAGSSPAVTVHDTGFHGAGTALFRGATVYVCPSSSDGSAARVIARFWSEVMGAEPVIMPAESIDRRTAWRAQLPALVATAIARAQSSGGTAFPRAAGGPPGEDAALQAGLLLANRAEVLGALDGVGANLAELRRLLSGGDRAALEALLEAPGGPPGHGPR
jgi:prephenate dehydrogenase